MVSAQDIQGGGEGPWGGDWGGGGGEYAGDHRREQQQQGRIHIQLKCHSLPDLSTWLYYLYILIEHYHICKGCVQKNYQSISFSFSLTDSINTQVGIYIHWKSRFFFWLSLSFQWWKCNCLVFMSCLSTQSKPMSRNPQQALMGYLQFRCWDNLRYWNKGIFLWQKITLDYFLSKCEPWHINETKMLKLSIDN